MLFGSGSEERGLLGSKAYVADHADELPKIALNINMDMIGSTMGKFNACCTCDKSLVSYLQYMGLEMGWGIEAFYRYDRPKVVSPAQTAKDIDFIAAFTARMADAVICPVPREIPGDIKEKIDKYMFRKKNS